MILYVENKCFLQKSYSDYQVCSVSVQDTRATSKNQLYFYILAMNNQKLKFNEISVTITVKI